MFRKCWKHWNEKHIILRRMLWYNYHPNGKWDCQMEKSWICLHIRFVRHNLVAGTMYVWLIHHSNFDITRICGEKLTIGEISNLSHSRRNSLINGLDVAGLGEILWKISDGQNEFYTPKIVNWSWLSLFKWKKNRIFPWNWKNDVFVFFSFLC